MKKTLKILRIVVLAFLVVLLVVVVAVGLFAGRAVKAGIETAGSQTLKVGVTLDKASLSILGGKLALDNLRVDNPPGYQHEKLLELKAGKVAVDLRSLMGDVVNIRQIKLDGMIVTLEQRGVSGNNLQDILKSLPKSDKGEPGGAAAEPSGKKLHIDTLELTGVTVKAKLLPIPGKVDTVTLKLAPIKMTDLGGDNKLDTAGLIGKILVAVAGGIAEQGAGILPDDMLNAMADTLGKTLELGKDAIKNVGELGKDILGGGKDISKPVEDLGKGVGDALKGILKPKD